jgi:hypothetical protein
MQDDSTKVWLVQDCRLPQLQVCSSSALHFISGLDARGRAVGSSLNGLVWVTIAAVMPHLCSVSLLAARRNGLLMAMP